MMNTALLIVFFPLIIPLWERVPLDSKNTEVPQSLTYMDDKAIAQIKSFCSAIQDPRIRTRLVNGLAEANNKTAISTLEELLHSEKNPSVRDNILKTIILFGKNAELKKPAALKTLFADPSSSVRCSAALLYLHNTHDSKPFPEMLEKEKSLFVKNSLWNALFNDSGKPDILDFAKFLESSSATDRAGAAKLIASRATEPDTVPGLVKLVNDKEVSVRYALAEGIKAGSASSVKLPEMLSSDKSASVRAVIASLGVSSARGNAVIINLSQDPDSEVRRIACVNLANYSDNAALDALLRCFSDPSAPVRTAAEDAVISINPKPQYISAMEALLDDASARNAAIRVLAALGVKNAAPAIAKILAAKDASAETRARAITALGQLSYDTAAKLIAGQATSKSNEIRSAVATALGRLNIQSTYDTIIKLSADKDLPTALRAVAAMGRTSNMYFEKTLLKIISDVSPKNLPEMRSAACWSLARINSTDEKVIAQLRTLIQKKVISMEMEKVYDADYVRASAMLALLKLAQNDPQIKTTALKTLDYYYTNPFLKEGDNSPAMDDYMRQICLYYKNLEIGPEVIETTSSTPCVTKYPPEKEVRKKKKIEPPVNISEELK